MTYRTDTIHDFIPSKRGHLSSRIFSQTLPGAIALALSALFGVWILYVRPADTPNPVKTPAVAPQVTTASNPYGVLVDPRFSSASTPVSLAKSLPLKSSFESIPPGSAAAVAEPENVLPMPRPAVSQLSASAPLPVPRPPELGLPAIHSPFPSGRRLAQQNRKTVPPATPADNRTFFEKLFGISQPSGPALAYAAPEDGVHSNVRSLTSNPSPGYDRYTAVYDISAHTVYMPNGTRLEAHSGLGNRLDDPRYVHERMRGPTPPSVYELQPRESLFHGIQALRLIPIGGGGDPYGRTGLLAHTYMLGPNGDSNGCVSIKNYNAFLQAFQNGEIKRLVVVARSS
jgi:Protein of unknown function (DUF2778)